MILDFVNGFFLNPIGLIALASIIPLIIIYLIKEKPKVQFFPSVKFLIKKKKNRFLSNISKYIKDPLFLLQLIALIILSASLAEPYVNISENAAAGNVLIILDGSASMQAVNNGLSRFDEAKSIAFDNIGDTTSIIIATEFPEILTEKSDNRQARRLLETVKPKDTSTNLYDAIILADDYLEKGDTVVLISDFLHTKNDKEIKTAIDVIRSKGIKIILKNVMKSSSNVGIIDAEVKYNTTTVRVKNYENSTISGSLSVSGNSVAVTLQPLGFETYKFSTPPGTSEIVLNVQDSFSVDNKIYVSKPEHEQIRILYITNQKDMFLYTALSLVEGVKIDIAEPPVVNNYDYDVFVIKNIDSEKMVPSIIQNIKDRLSEGSSVIVSAGNYLDYVNFQEITGNYIKKQSDVKVNVESVLSSITKDVEFGTSKTYFSASGEIQLAKINEDSVISLQKSDSGYVLFYGLLDNTSTFQYELYYPVFWKRVLTQIVGREDINKINIKTGDIISSDGSIIDPEGNELNSKSLVAEETGFYRLSDKVVASNLIDEKESDINGFFVDVESLEFSASDSRKIAPKTIVFYFLIFAVLLIFFDLLYIKFRGDI